MLNKLASSIAHYSYHYVAYSNTTRSDLQSLHLEYLKPLEIKVNLL
jgi:hypothetical protein